METYSSMKHTGLSWIGDIPSHWRLLRMKNVFQNVSEKNHPDAMVLSLYREHGVLPKDSRDDNHNVTSEDTGAYKFVKVNDLVINKMKAWQGSLGISQYEGIVSPAYYVCRFINQAVSEKYFHYLLRSKNYAQEFERLSTGMRIGQWDLGIDDFMCVPAIIPPLDEQEAIANYLDEQIPQIDSIIEEARKSIEEYGVWRKAEIFETVTKGLNPNVKMRATGINWLGSIPADWRIVKITRLLDYNHPYPIGDGDHGLVKPADYLDTGIPYIRVQNLGWGTEISLDNIVYISETTNSKIASSTLKPNDILFAKTGATIGKTGIIPQSIPIANTTSHVGKITILDEYNPKFVLYVLSSQFGFNQFWEAAAKKTTRPELSIDEIKAVKVLLPPTREEQDKIVEYLDQKICEIDGMIEAKQGVIADLETYKHSLIYEAVTGKRKVV